ncbi:MAG TPA: TIGR03620 family F420-dependent LLM class oxidoreductase [Solirubrobacteraceae bacterium]|nr:TIGR03620 family F420-dependent LLM class oxidoreductase [Solirubrobacteraceae bacterium]
MELTRFGIFTMVRTLGAEKYGEAAALAEELGFGAIWLGGSPRLTDLRPMLAATSRIVVASGIANVWQYEPAELTAEYQQLEAEFPGRTLVGIGIGHPERTAEYVKPLTKMREFLDGLDHAEHPIPKNRMILAALGPKMVELGGERTLGAHPYFSPVEHTRFAREHLEAEAILAPEQALVIDDDPERARTAARDYASFYLELANYTANLQRMGWGEADIAEAGSDRLLDAIVPQGSAEDAAEVVQRQLDAGADHVCVQTVGVSGVPVNQWTALARALGL